MDIGQPPGYTVGLCYLELLRQKTSELLASGTTYVGSILVHESAVIGDGCSIGIDVSIGRGCVIESAGIHLSCCTIMCGVHVTKHMHCGRYNQLAFNYGSMGMN